APALQTLMTRAVRNAKAPIFFFQAANDFDLSPSKTLSTEMDKAGKPYQLKIYPPYGDSPGDGHTFGYFGAQVWSPDVFQFLTQHCPEYPPPREHTLQGSHTRCRGALQRRPRERSKPIRITNA